MLSREISRELLEKKLVIENMTELMIFDEHTIGNEKYFVFFCNSREFYSSGDYSDLIIGNTTFIVDRSNGRIFETGTAEPIEYYIELFEKGIL